MSETQPEPYNHRLEALHNYERLLDQALEAEVITGQEHEECLKRFQNWVYEPITESHWLMPEDNMSEPHDTNYEQFTLPFEQTDQAE